MMRLVHEDQKIIGQGREVHSETPSLEALWRISSRMVLRSHLLLSAVVGFLSGYRTQIQCSKAGKESDSR